eukprot:TRINITY_DN27300_c0_g1_i2.p1 TRINITY_DN27300_c0_g1~~TRINITY_DN27300_c0_g1_i2.p1  ORF type:complete len:546 (+),score=217.37 TRINITY_DN27300_c0_g1_i2:56-1693(+)
MAALLVALAATVASSAPGALPNIVFLICESTDGRTYREGFAPVPIPHVRSLAQAGTQFDTHYANVPVCCPSRASTWSGRLPHKIPHNQSGTGLPVGGVWNNFEGLAPGYDQKIMDVLGDNGYNVKVSGKEDWTAGSHSTNVRLNAWTMYAQFPYSVNETGGWYDEAMCSDNPTIEDSQSHYSSAHESDWADVNSTTQWIRDYKEDKPFFAYQGMAIVHPPYATNEYWYDKIDLSQVTVPDWEPLMELHPCDFEASMLKKCTPSNNASSAFYSAERRRTIRAVYYAMIAEFDAMVGAYVDAVEAAGLTDNTIFIVTSDHGDMNMEHQQFYKMVQYDASSRVPLVIKTPYSATQRLVTSATSHIDLFPTILEFAGVDRSKWPAVLDGQSLVDFVNGTKAADTHQYAVSQFHGDNIAMSWYHVTDGEWKYVVFGTGTEVPPQLFNLRQDVDEVHNVAASHLDVVEKLDAALRAVVDYPSVSQEVAQYNYDSFVAFQKGNPDWKDVMSGDLRWSAPFNVNTTASFEAVDKWLSEGPTIKACRLNLTWQV